uniref:Uncharacterized protein n=1 Tax=viral metagenome TaxID=1070528 RepID=A0A6C0JM75_9ZZZZ
MSSQMLSIGVIKKSSTGKYVSTKPLSPNTWTFIHSQKKYLLIASNLVQNEFSSYRKKTKKFQINTFVNYTNPITKDESVVRIMYHTVDGRYIVRILDADFNFTTSEKTLSHLEKETKKEFTYSNKTIKKSPTIRNLGKFCL